MAWEPDWLDWWLAELALFWLKVPLGAIDCMVVRVVVSERTEGAGDEKVLSPPLRESIPQPAVRLVPASDDAPCEGAVIEREVSWSVEMVGAMDRPPAVGGGWPSADNRRDSPRPRDVMLEDLALLPVDMDGWLFCEGTWSPMRPDWGYGLLFCDGCFFAALRLDDWRLGSPEEAALRLASFFINVENGRRLLERVARSWGCDAVSVMAVMAMGECCKDGGRRMMARLVVAN